MAISTEIVGKTFGPFLRPISVLQPPFFCLVDPSCFVALLREICPATVAGACGFCGVPLALAGTRVSFSSSALPPLPGPCAFAESALLI